MLQTSFAFAQPVLPMDTSQLSNRVARVGIVGGGNSARALAAYLASQGHKVSILVRDLDKLPNIAETLNVRASGKIEGRFNLQQVATEPAVLLPQVDIVFIATVTTAYAEVAQNLAPYLESHHKVVLFSGKLGGALLFSRALELAGGPNIPVLETDSLFACRVQDDESIWIRGFKRWTLFSGTSRSVTEREGDVITRFFPGLQAATNIIERGLTDFGALAHAPVVLANMNAIDRQESFLFYYKGLTSRTVAILEHIEEEFNLVAAAYGASLIPMKELLNRYYGCDTSSLHQAMQTVPNYRYSQSPPSLDHRFLVEDVTATLVPLQQFARLANVSIPVVDSVVTLAGVLTGIDFQGRGRSLKQYGLDGLSYEQVHEAINA
ncbi:MAG: NAD/NADP octopine/nopaline dehydrogenase family protein [Candidatus Obscuribacterales bacterium]|jgi:opine dehydrogenase